MTKNYSNEKHCGILCPIISLPNDLGIGSLGKEAYEFVDFLKEAGVGLWQLLPLNFTSFGNSPYQSPSNDGLNFNFIDLKALVEEDLLSYEEIYSCDWGNNPNRVDYGALFNNKLKILRLAFSRFAKNDKDFQEFISDNYKIKDFALFMVIKEMHKLKPWYEWETKYKNYSKRVENEVLKVHKDNFLFYMWTQFVFLKQYKKLKKYANDNGISIMGDLPIYVAYDSVEVWKYPKLFELDENHEPINVAGCPPDCFSVDGQLWGNPLYNWKYHKRTKYRWWNERIENALKLYDFLRIDHFRGFSAYYSIPFKDDTARNGRWVKGPGFDLFKDKLNLNIIAEDLGMIDDDFLDLMKKTNYPGMKIVTQGFDNDDESNTWRPSNYDYNFYAYTSTHDSETTKQYLDNLNKEQKERLLRIVKCECSKLKVDYEEDLSNEGLTYKLIELDLASNAKVSVIPIYDLLKVGKEGRINFPSTVSDDNWSWRMSKEDFDSNKESIQKTLSEWIKKYQRN